MLSKPPKKAMSDHDKGVAYGLLAAGAFGTYVLINRYVYITYEAEAFSYTTTFLVSGGVFAALSLVFHRAKKQVFQIIHRDTVPVLINGLLAAVGIGLMVFGQRYTTAINASIIATSSIVSTLLFSKLLLKEMFSRRQQAWLVVMFVGLYVAIVGTQLINLKKGDLIIFGASMVLGFTNTFSKILMRKRSSSFVADVRLVTGGLFLIFAGLLINGSNLLVTYAGFWPVLAGFAFWLTIKFMYAAIQYIKPSEAIVLANSHPFFTAMVGVLLLSESYSLTKFVGSVVVLLSVYHISKK